MMELRGSSTANAWPVGHVNQWFDERRMSEIDYCSAIRTIAITYYMLLYTASS
jgi:hypothetical protein